MILEPVTVLLPQELSISDSPTFLGLTLSGLTEGSVLFAGSGGVLSEDNSNLFWDDTNNRLGIGTASPAVDLDVAGTARVNILELLDDEPIKLGTGADALIDYDSGTEALEFDLTGVANTDLNVRSSGDANTFFIDGQNARVGIRTNAPESVLHIKGVNPEVSIEDPVNGGEYAFGSRAGAFQIVDNYLGVIQRFLFMYGDLQGGGTGLIQVNGLKRNIDFTYSGQTTTDFFKMDASAEEIQIKDNIPIVLGTGHDALIDYDSGNNSLDIDLTGGVNTGLRILSDGGTLSLDGSTGDWLLAGADKFQFGDSGTYINQGTDGHLDLTADVSIDMNANVDISAKNIITDTTTGTKIGTATSQKLGFYNATPIIQPSGTGETTGFTAGSGTGVNDDSTFTGNVGSTAYRISDIVKALKQLGLLAQ